MDYHVFIVSRIKELHDDGLPTSEAVAQGISTTAGTVTAAAAVMVAVFAIFASLPTLDIKQLGVGLAVAVLLDATLIRGVLLPATMKMLGEWNWYLPRWLGWLPRAKLELGPPRPAASGPRPQRCSRSPSGFSHTRSRTGRSDMQAVGRGLTAGGLLRRLLFAALGDPARADVVLSR